MINFATSYVRHDAIRAGVIAAPHDRDDRPNFVVDARYSEIQALISRAAVEKPISHRTEIFNRLGSHDKIHERKAVLEIFLRSLRGTPGHDNLAARPFRFPSSETPDFRKCPIFGVLPDRTSIDQHH